MNPHPASQPLAAPERNCHGRLFSIRDQDQYLDAVQLDRLERSFREWTEATSRADVRASRRRILLIFLIIRYAGAKLSEVLHLDPGRDIDGEKGFVLLGRQKGGSGRSRRQVQVSGKLLQEIRALMAEAPSKHDPREMFQVDPGFVRRKFYERAEACGIAKQLGAPEVLRKSRAVELLQNNLPLPAVQLFLGHSTPNLTSAYVSFSEDDIRQVTRSVVEKESARKTSARNSFYGKIQAIQQGDIQARVELATLGGHRVITVITNDSLQRLGLKAGKLITAEVKAPWVTVHKSDPRRESSAENMFAGVVQRIARGEINTEYLVRLADGTAVCAVITSESSRRLALAEGDEAWVSFSSVAVVLLAE